jgi:hypothetical protein
MWTVRDRGPCGTVDRAGPWTVRDRGPSGFEPDRLQTSTLDYAYINCSYAPLAPFYRIDQIQIFFSIASL